jgi:hypothetical protein
VTFLETADAWRYAAALFSLVVLLLLTAGLIVHGDGVSTAWRWVLRAVVLEQAYLAYVIVVRAKSTPKGYPDGGPDLALVGSTVSALILLAACVGVFVHARHERRKAGAA